MMSLQASLLGFAVFRNTSGFGCKENVYLQTVAVATATMPLAAGFVGVIPALYQLSFEDNSSGPIELSAWQLIMWSLGLSLFGVMFAIPLRKETIVREQLKFPSGTATAQMIQVLHEKNNSDSLELQELDAPIEQGENMWDLKRHALIYSFGLSSVYTIASYFFPIIYNVPIFNWMSLNLVDFKAWEWYLTPSLSYIGQGIIMVTTKKSGGFVLYLIIYVGTSDDVIHVVWLCCWMGSIITIGILYRMGTGSHQ